MNFLPLCTARVCPTNSGITVERRDHVLMTFFSLTRFIASSFSSSGVSTNGPFFSERLITDPCRDSGLGARDSTPRQCLVVRFRVPCAWLLLPPLHDELI